MTTPAEWMHDFETAVIAAEQPGKVLRELYDTIPPFTTDPPDPPTGDQMPTTRDGWIIGADGQRLILLGTNTLCRFDGASSSSANYAAEKPDTIREFGWNFIRLGLSDGDQNKQLAGLWRDHDALSAMGVYSAASWWDYTSANKNPSWNTVLGNAKIMRHVNETIDRYADNPYVAFNLLNEPWEWVGTTDTAWANHAKAQYDWLRNEGWQGLIIWDMPSWAQQMDRVMDSTLFEGVTNGRPGLVLSWHLYSAGGQNDGLRDSWVQKCRDKKVPFIIGEFGAHWDMNFSGTIDSISEADRRACAKWVMSRALPKEFGGTWWDVAWLGYVMSLRNHGAAPWDTSQPLSHWGNEMIRLGEEHGDVTGRRVRYRGHRRPSFDEGQQSAGEGA
jgi:hypothetical protein